MWRSILFIPVLQTKYLNNAVKSGADAIVLDLEASIPKVRKKEARLALPNAIDFLIEQGVDVLVRVNTVWRECFQDIEVAARTGIQALVIPNVETSFQIKAIDGYLNDVEKEIGVSIGSIKIIPTIESAQGLLNVHEIVTDMERISALAFGPEDYATDMNTYPNSELLEPAVVQVNLAARSVGIFSLAIPYSPAHLVNLLQFKEAAEWASAMGTQGSFAIHPDQVLELNSVFSITQEEMDWAHRVVVAAETAENEGLGVFRLDDEMIDLPVISRAKRLIEKC